MPPLGIRGPLKSDWFALSPNSFDRVVFNNRERDEFHPQRKYVLG